MAATGDLYPAFPPNPSVGYIDGVAVTPNDSADLPFVCRAIMCTVGGTVTYVTPAGSTLQVTLTAAVLYPFRAKRINATGTAATGITAHV